MAETRAENIGIFRVMHDGAKLPVAGVYYGDEVVTYSSFVLCAWSGPSTSVAQYVFSLWF
jgi:hypothetical protein